ncbi:hypothetical protein KP509_29G026400 [Ceratopteris richardii]|uniref:Uncharacterized protein n=1 Tax=Ceratopteris richardii TaxID=49495 RepID=A0A8T2R787_CERRI|nr:hypothetical protein KP509_29G026400 [Ceratopteris richardii]
MSFLGAYSPLFLSGCWASEPGGRATLSYLSVQTKSRKIPGTSKRNLDTTLLYGPPDILYSVVDVNQSITSSETNQATFLLIPASSHIALLSVSHSMLIHELVSH